MSVFLSASALGDKVSPDYTCNDTYATGISCQLVKLLATILIAFKNIVQNAFLLPHPLRSSNMHVGSGLCVFGQFQTFFAGGVIGHLRNLLSE